MMRAKRLHEKMQRALFDGMGKASQSKEPDFDSVFARIGLQADIANRAEQKRKDLFERLPIHVHSKIEEPLSMQVRDPENFSSALKIAHRSMKKSRDARRFRIFRSKKRTELIKRVTDNVIQSAVSRVHGREGEAIIATCTDIFDGYISPDILKKI